MRLKNEYSFEYIINEEKNTVTCLVKVDRFDNRFYEAWTVYRYFTKGEHESDYSALKFETDYVFNGVARLKDGDTSDINLAKKVARAKALRQANSYMSELMYKVLTKGVNWIETLAKVATGTREESKKHDFDVVLLTSDHLEV